MASRTEVRYATVTEEERAEMCARRRAEMGDEAYAAMCRGVAERGVLARERRLAAEALYWAEQSVRSS